MALQLPAGFNPLAEIQKLPVGTVTSIIGTVQSWERIRPVGGGRCSQDIFLQDPSQRVESNNDLRINCFVDNEAQLPQIKEVGDIVLIRNATIAEFRGRQFLRTDRYRTAYLVFPRDTIPSLDFLDTYMGGKSTLPCRGDDGDKRRLQPIDMRYVIQLKAERLSYLRDEGQYHPSHRPSITGPALAHSLPSRPPPIHSHPDLHQHRSELHSKRPNTSNHNFERSKLEKSKARGKFRLVKDVAFEKDRNTAFVDLCVEVLSKWNTGYRYEVTVTDYTENSMLYNRLAPEEAQNGGWKSREDGSVPYGQRALKIVLEEPTRKWVTDNVQLGEIIMFLDVKLKLDNFQHLAGDIWMDRDYPDKVKAQRIFDKNLPEARDLLQRKQEYEQSRKRVKAEVVQPEEPEPVSREADRREKIKAKKLRRKERLQAAALAEAEKLSNANKNVQCSAIDVETTSIRELLDASNRCHINNLPHGTSYILPFVNASFKAKMHVLDFFPDKLEDFAVAAPPDEHASTQDNAAERWQWSFQLLVQDATVKEPTENDRMVLNVGHAQAQFLFGSKMPDPDDLHNNLLLLTKLRETLFVLWGDLEERKQAGEMDLDNKPSSNRPFEGCIWEYGELQDGADANDINAWTKQHMLHGVTII